MLPEDGSSLCAMYAYIPIISEGVWINGCVFADNYKFFILFLMWTSLLCLMAAIASLPPAIRFIMDQKSDVPFC